MNRIEKVLLFKDGSETKLARVDEDTVSLIDCGEVKE
jgi:hypothetical protein